MSRVAATLFGMASAAGLLAAGCSTRPGSCGTCPTASFDLHALDDSTVTWSVSGAPPQTSTAFVPSPPSAGQCSFRYNRGWIINYSSADRENVISGSIDIGCASVGGGGFDMSVRDPGDFRGWQASNWQMAAAAGSVIADVGPPSGVGCNGLYFDGTELTIAVEAAAGGPADFPKVVTDDFARTFRLDYDTSTVTPTRAGGQACGITLSAQVSVHLTQTAADYVANPNASCGCE